EWQAAEGCGAGTWVSEGQRGLVLAANLALDRSPPKGGQAADSAPATASRPYIEQPEVAGSRVRARLIGKRKIYCHGTRHKRTAEYAADYGVRGEGDCGLMPMDLGPSWTVKLPAPAAWLRPGRRHGWHGWLATSVPSMRPGQCQAGP